ncbi:MAG TPA: CoA transferase [Candidatus Binataceae bacterium]|nr:CoA transferase [Candidatus Binataceae bacterium]
MSAPGSLDGFRIIDLTQGLCGPFCTMQLGDGGADVIKIEPPNGEYARRMGPPFVGDESAVFLSLNRNKKSVTLDLATDAGRDAVRKLAAKADVVVEDFGPDAASKIGLGYDQLKQINSKLIYCAISPFGEEGPLRDAPGSELVIQAMAEYTASLGRIGEPPVRVGADIASLNTGIFAAQAILAALFHRLRAGEGQRVAVSEFGSLLHMRGIMWSALSDPDDWFGFHLDHYTKPPDYGYQAKDGSFYFILRRGDSEGWDKLIMGLGMEEVLADPRFDDYGRAATSIGRYATEVKPIWEKAFANRSRGELIDLIKGMGGDAVPIMDYPALMAHPQVAALDIVTEVTHPTAGSLKMIRPVARFSDTPNSIRLPPPLLGQHTAEVLDAVGILSR